MMIRIDNEVKYLQLAVLILVLFHLSSSTMIAQGSFGSIFYSEILNSNLTQNDTIEIVVTTYMHQFDQPGGGPCHNLIGVTAKDSLDHLVFDLLYDMTSPAFYTPCFQNDTISHFPFQITTKEIVIRSHAIDAALDTSRFTTDTIILAQLGIEESEGETTALRNTQGTDVFYHPEEGLHFRSGKAQSIQSLRVFNSIGQLMWMVPKMGLDDFVPLTLDPGIYFITWEQEGHQWSTRIVVP